MSMFIYGIRRMARAWRDGINEIAGHRVVTDDELPSVLGQYPPPGDEERKQAILQVTAHELFGCDVTVYRRQRQNGPVEYVIVLIDDTPQCRGGYTP